MHEMSLAVEIVDLAVKTAERENGERISHIEIEVGSLAGVLVDSLEFCLGAAARSTRAEDSTFQINPRMAQGKCKDCDSDFEVVSYYQNCPRCDGINVEITGGQELKVAAITIEDNTNDV